MKCMSQVETWKEIHQSNIVKRCSVVYIVVFKRISHLVLVFLLLTLNIYSNWRMGILPVHHLNNPHASDRQWFKKPDKDAFVFIIAFQSIPKRATNQFRKSLRNKFFWNLALVNKQMLAYKFIEKDPCKRSFP